jgi:O-antigen/teichoic acid export membrane protein
MAVALAWLFGAHGAAILGGYLVGCLIALAGFRIIAGGTERAHLQSAPVETPLREVSHRLRHYALPLIALPLIGWVSGQADRYLVGGFAGVAATGVYAALYGLASKPFLVLSAGADSALRQPYYARASSGNSAAERYALALWLTAVAGVSIVLWLLLALLHADIAALLLAKEYRAHSVLMAWVAGGYVLLCLAQVFERVCYAHHDTRGVLWVEASGAALSVVVAGPLVYTYGIAGAAWAVPVYFGAQLVIAAARARRAWRHRPPPPVSAGRSPASPVAR